MNKQLMQMDSLIAENKRLKGEVGALKFAITHIIDCDKINTGREPSISCFHRSLDEAAALVDEGFNGAYWIKEINADFLDSILDEISPDGGGNGTWSGLKSWLGVYAKRHRLGKTLDNTKENKQ